MSAEIVQFSTHRAPEKFGPREALIEMVMAGNDVMKPESAGFWADWILSELGARGFVVAADETVA